MSKKRTTALVSTALFAMAPASALAAETDAATIINAVVEIESSTVQTEVKKDTVTKTETNLQDDSSIHTNSNTKAESEGETSAPLPALLPLTETSTKSDVNIQLKAVAVMDAKANETAVTATSNDAPQTAAAIQSTGNVNADAAGNKNVQTAAETAANETINAKAGANVNAGTSTTAKNTNTQVNAGADASLETNVSKKAVDGSLVIDSSVTSFSDIQVSGPLQEASGTVSLNGDVAIGDKQVHPVYKFDLVNDRDVELSGQTVVIPFPEGYVLDESFPQEVLITPNNQNPRLDDVTYTVADSGLTLTLPELAPEEAMKFDVKFFLVKKADGTVLPEEVKENVQMAGKAIIQANGDQSKISGTITVQNDNSAALKNVTLRLSLQDMVEVETLELVGGAEGTITIRANGLVDIVLPELQTGENNIGFVMNGRLQHDAETLTLPVSLLAGDEVLQTRSVIAALSTGDIEEVPQEQAEETPNVDLGTAQGGLTYTDAQPTYADNIAWSGQYGQEATYDYQHSSLPKTGSAMSDSLWTLLGLLATAAGAFFYRRGHRTNGSTVK